MATTPIDYAKLAAQAGAVSSTPAPSGIPDPSGVDYAKLAAQAGAINSTPPAKPRTWTDSVGDAASEYWNQVNPVAAVKSLATAVNHPIDTAGSLLNAQGEVGKKAYDSAKAGDYVSAARHGLDYLLPIIGPQIDRAGDLAQSGQYAKSAGATAGIATNIAAPELLKGVSARLPVGELPERLYQSALKPSPALAASKVQGMVQSGLDNSIPVSATGVEKLGGLISDLGDKVSAEIQAGSNAGATVDPFKVASRLSDTSKRFANQVNPEGDLNAIGESGNEFLRNNPAPIPAADAQALKQGTYTALKDRTYGQQGTATVEAQKALARGIKEELENQFPEIQGLNAQQGQAASLQKSLTRAVQRIDNHQLLGIGTPLAAGAGGAIAGAPGAAVMGVLKFVLDQPEFKSKLAYTLSRAGKGVPLPAAAARIAAYSTQLGNAMAPELLRRANAAGFLQRPAQ
jgi:hypothetical protein